MVEPSAIGADGNFQEGDRNDCSNHRPDQWCRRGQHRPGRTSLYCGGQPSAGGFPGPGPSSRDSPRAVQPSWCGAARYLAPVGRRVLGSFWFFYGQAPRCLPVVVNAVAFTGYGWDDGVHRKLRRLVIKEEMRKAADAAEEASNSRTFEIVARAGYAVSGLLHVLIGVIALQLAFGRGGEADVSGAVASLASQPVGPVLLWACFGACAALALWQLGNAILGERTSSKKLTKRLSAAGQALVFAALAATIVSFIMGQGKNSRESSSDFTLTLLSAPFGVFLLVAIGAGIAITGIVFAVRGFRQTFKRDISLSSEEAVRKFQVGVGVVGYIAKGIALFLVGLLVVIAAIRAQPEQSTGLDGSLKALREQPYGPYLLAAVAVGLIAYGLFLMVKAKSLRT